MSGKNIVNPDHYKIAGRDRPGEDVVHERERQSLATARARNERRRSPLRPRPGSAAGKTGDEEDQES